IELTIVVMGGSGMPTIKAPTPIVIPVDPNNQNNLTESDLMVSGVSAEDPDDGDLTGDIRVIMPGTPIPADKEGVYQVTYVVEDHDANEAEETRAVVLDDGSYFYDENYIATARSFIIGVSDVTPYDAINQLLRESEAAAWNTKGEPATAVINSTGAYKELAGDYFPVIGVYGYPGISKRIQAMVVDDAITTPANGDRYAIKANTFRINLADAGALAGETGADYANVFIARSAAKGYLRIGTELLAGGTVELVGDVVSKADASKNFTAGGFTEGDVYLATFMIAEESATRTTVEVLVSNGNPPVLTVPAHKEVSLGGIFTDADYMSGVSANDVEYGTIPSAWINHNKPVNTAVEEVYEVTYSARDNEYNVATKAGFVLVGDWYIEDDYAIVTHPFTKRLSEVTGTEAEAISYADVRAYDLRDEIISGGALVANPKFGKRVEVKVSDDGGYYDKKQGEFNITFAIKDHPTVTRPAVAKVVAGNKPVLNLPVYKQIQEGDSFPEGARYDATPSYMQSVYATDTEDDRDGKPLRVGHNSPVPPAPKNGDRYKITYNVTDSDTNFAEKSGMLLVGPWVVGKDYAIYAQDFSRTLSQVTGTTAEMIAFAGARAIDMRLTLPNGNANPNFGDEIPVSGIVVTNDGGYSDKRVGTFNITFAVRNEISTTITIAARVGAGTMPTLNVPDVKVVPYGGVFGEAQYMQDVSANDAEDGIITARVAHDSPVNTGVEGYYVVSYNVTDSDGNTAYRTSIVLVGDWVVGEGYAINAYDFTRRVSQVRGTDVEMLNAARVQALCVDSGNPNFGGVVQAIVQDDGGYGDQKAGAFPIRFAVQAAPGVAKTITATVTSGNAPVLTVPSVRTVPEGAGFGYMVGVTAADDEDGVITNKVIYNTPVNTNNVGAYKITYSVTDSDGNTTVKYGMALVGRGWVVSGGYALYAQDFAKKLSEITGTRAEATRLAKAMAVWVGDTTDPGYGKYVPVTIVDRGSYRKAPGNYKIVFAVAESRAVTKTITASISDDTPRTPNITTITTTTPAPNVIVNTPEPAPAPEPEIVEVPAPVVPEAAPETTVSPIEPAETPLATPESRGAWHLIDLILVILTLAIGFYLMIYALRRKDEEDEWATSKGKQIRMWGQLGIILGIVSVIALLFTQTFTGDMKIIDIWAVLFATILGVEVIALFGVRRDKVQSWEKERDI
ncbi:MAG: DUF5011 domain-containing protein, partial [Clostridiales Family XIII bacterium]|nr:DUF5011 domain-containing protein [Clostridiales Family XIII bacterium]